MNCILIFVGLIIAVIGFKVVDVLLSALGKVAFIMVIALTIIILLLK